MSYTYLLEQGEESSAECFSDIPASALSKLNLTAGKSSSSGSETDACQSSLSGMTLRRSTGTHGAASLMWYAGDSLVRTYLPPEKEKVSEANDLDCGPSSPGSLAKFNPHLYGWKTRQCSLFGGLEWFSETYPRWGLMHDGELFPLPTPVHLTSENESGYSRMDGDGWPTPNATVLEPNPKRVLALQNTGKPAKRKDGGEYHVKLEEMVAARMIPTPTRRDYKDGSKPRIRGGQIQQDTLGSFVMLYPTPTKSDYRSPNLNPAKNGQTEPASGHALPAAVGGQLNPTWVEWLMGWPIEWSDLKPLATDKFQQWLDSHGQPSVKTSEPPPASPVPRPS